MIIVGIFNFHNIYSAFENFRTLWQLWKRRNLIPRKCVLSIAFFWSSCQWRSPTVCVLDCIPRDYPRFATPCELWTTKIATLFKKENSANIYHTLASCRSSSFYYTAEASKPTYEVGSTLIGHGLSSFRQHLLFRLTACNHWANHQKWVIDFPLYSSMYI